MHFTNYKGLKIHYTEAGEKFVVGRSDNPDFEHTTLKGIKALIDKYLAQSFKRFRAFGMNWCGLNEIEITSVDVSQRHVRATIKYDGKARNKNEVFQTAQIFTYDKHNKALFDRYKLIESIVEDYKDEMESIESKLKKIKIEDYKNV